MASERKRANSVSRYDGGHDRPPDNVLLTPVADPDGTTRSRVGTLGKLLIAAIAGGLVLAAIALPTVGGIGLATRSSISTFDHLPSQLKDDGNPPQTSVIVAGDGTTQIANLYLQNRQVVPLAKIPPVARQALIAIEDSRFYEHHGVDTRGVLRALVSNGKSGTVRQGGSTLTQQYVKQVLLYQATNSSGQQQATADTLARKLREARLALALENKLSKDQILARYMNIAYFGSGAYGIETAAHTYFGVPASQLSLPQAALLAGMVQSPNGYDPYRHKTLARDRRHEVLTRMQQQGYIKSAQMHAADKTPIRLAQKAVTPANGCSETITPSTGFFCDYVRNYLTDVLHLTRTQLYNGGLTIRTTLNAGIQAHVQAGIGHYVPLGNPAAAVMDVVQPGTGRVLAMAVNRTYGSGPKQTTINLGVRAVAHAGSTYKVFTLAAALQKKVPFSYVINSPATAVAPGLGYTRAQPAHNDNGEVCQTCDLQRATVQSVNTYFVKLLDSPYFGDDLSLPVKDAQRMGLSAHTLSNTQASDIISSHRGAFTLGYPATSPLDMATAYATIAANGKMCPPNPILSITDSTGKALPVKTPACQQVLDPKIANGMSNIMRGDTQSSVGYNTTQGLVNVGNNHAAAGKTGTDNASGGLWFVGYTPQLAGSVAVFNPDAPSHPVATIPGHPAPLFGRFSAGIWQAALGGIIDGQPASAWLPTDPSVVFGDSVPVPCVVGSSVGAASNSLAGQGFNSFVTSTVDSATAAGTVIGQNPACGGRISKGQQIGLRTSNGKLKKKPVKKKKPPTHGRPGPPTHPPIVRPPPGHH